MERSINRFLPGHAPANLSDRRLDINCHNYQTLLRATVWKRDLETPVESGNTGVLHEHTAGSRIPRQTCLVKTRGLANAKEF